MGVYGVLLHDLETGTPICWEFYDEGGNDEHTPERVAGVTQAVGEAAAYEAAVAAFERGGSLAGEGGEEGGESREREAVASGAGMLEALGSAGLGDVDAAMGGLGRGKWVGVEEGVFRARGRVGGGLLARDAVVVWRSVNKVAFSLVVREEENMQAAASFLKILSLVLAEHFKSDRITESPGDLLERTDEIHGLLLYLLPVGELMVMTVNMARHLRKEGEVVIKA